MIFLLSDRPLAFEEIDQFVREGSRREAANTVVSRNYQ